MLSAAACSPPAIPAATCAWRGTLRKPSAANDIDCPQLAGAYLGEPIDDLTDTDCPPELRCLGRTLARWHTAIVKWHRAGGTNGPTEAVNDLVKRVKRVAFGFHRFAYYRILAPLYAGKPNWALLATITPRSRPKCQQTEVFDWVSHFPPDTVINGLIPSAHNTQPFQEYPMWIRLRVDDEGRE